MSWSPNPLDYDYPDDNSIYNTNGRDVQSQLPSKQAMRGFGGSTYARKKLAERRRSARPPTSTDEVINMNQARQSFQETQFGDEVVPHPTAKRSSNVHLGQLSAGSDNFLEDLTYKDLDMLKELYCPMSKKKDLRHKILAEEGRVGRKSKLSSGKNVKWRRFKEDASDALQQLQLWRSSIHEIEGRFGNGIRSYFAFLRWLFLLNIYIFLLVFFFIVVPMIVYERTISSGTASTPSVPTECVYDPYDPNSINTFPQYIIWWFTGQGFMENTLLFYGYYENIIIAGNFIYNIPLAYLLVALSYFLLSLVLLVRRAALGLKESLSSDDQFYSYCNKVFCGWDYCITDERASELKQNSLKNELQTDLDEERIRRRQENRTRNEKIILYSKRIVINLFVLVILGASLVGIFFAAQYALSNGSTYDDNFILDLIVTYLTSIVITVANFIAPLVFELLVVYEDYSPEFAIRLTLIRTVFLRLASVVFLYVVVYLQVNCNIYDNIVDATYNNNCMFCVGVECWETYLGQEMYKLTLLDFFIVIAVTLFVEFPRKLIVSHCSCGGFSKWLGQQEFSIPVNVLDIVYAQTICWIGAFYAPLLPAMVVIKFFVFFYLKKLTLMYNCRPSTRPYRASKSGTFFFIILLFGFAVAAVPVAVGVGVLAPSRDCGPFRLKTSMFSAVTESIQTLPEWMQQMFWFFGSSGFSAIIIVLLCLVLYYFFALGSAHKKMISLLKNQLTLEGKDKQFLLGRVNKLNEKLQQGKPRAKKERRTSTPPGVTGHVNEAYSRESTNSTLPGQPDDRDAMDF